VSFDQALELASMAHITIKENAALPSSLEVDGKQIGTGSLLQLFCRVYLDIHSGEIPDRYPVESFDPYPREHEEAIVSEVEGFKYWPVHRPDLDMSKLVLYTRLQLWTLKPAHERG
jgi:hypothetical protein